LTAAVSLDLDAMMTNPFPYFAAMRAADQWTWSEQMQMWLVTRFNDVVFVDANPQIFSAEVPGALLTRSIGLTMIRSEGAAHRRFRNAADTPLKRRSVQRSWPDVIAGLVAQHLVPLREHSAADLVQDFAGPFTGACLRAVLGLPDASAADIERWSNSYIGGLINNSDDPDVWAETATASAEARDCVAAVLDRVRAEPDATVVSAMANAYPDAPLSLEEITANIRLMIAGGFNDARDAVATLPWLLMTHPEIRARAAREPADFERSIDESVRWLSPVGSYPRILTEDYSSPAATLSAGDKVLVVAASANWDETTFAQPETFDIDRPNLDEHLGFSVGTHYCLGSHLVRAMVRAAVPALLELPGIHPTADPQFVGWQFRGPLSVPVAFEPSDEQEGTP